MVTWPPLLLNLLTCVNNCILHFDLMINAKRNMCVQYFQPVHKKESIVFNNVIILLHEIWEIFLTNQTIMWMIVYLRILYL